LINIISATSNRFILSLIPSSGKGWGRNEVAAVQTVNHKPETAHLIKMFFAEPPPYAKKKRENAENRKQETSMQERKKFAIRNPKRGWPNRDKW
jgi:hypothetical protein